MSPVDDFVEQLTTEQTRAVDVRRLGSSPVPSLVSHLTAMQVHYFTCDHIVGGSQLLPLALMTGPSNRPLKLTFEERKRGSVMGELGAVLLAACQGTPDGVVAFLPSYDYEEKVYQAWTSQGWLAKLKARALPFQRYQVPSDMPL